MMPPILEADSLRMTFADPDRAAFLALDGMSLAVSEGEFLAVVGPSGCGKSTLLRCLNRMNDLIDGAHVSAGQIRIDGVNINDPRVDVIELRKRVGMVFQKSNPFPKSIYENITYGLRLQGLNGA